MAKEKPADYLTQTERQLLEDWCVSVRQMIGEAFGPFLVGSVLHKPDYRDVDLRALIPYKKFIKLFPDEYDDYARTPRLKYINLAVSLWGQKVTGLPIDFQFQIQEVANKNYPGPEYPRHAKGITL